MSSYCLSLDHDQALSFINTLIGNHTRQSMPVFYSKHSWVSSLWAQAYWQKVERELQQLFRIHLKKNQWQNKHMDTFSSYSFCYLYGQFLFILHLDTTFPPPTPIHSVHTTNLPLLRWLSLPAAMCGGSASSLVTVRSVYFLSAMTHLVCATKVSEIALMFLS